MKNRSLVFSLAPALLAGAIHAQSQVESPKPVTQDSAVERSEASTSQLIEEVVQPVFAAKKRSRSMMVGVLADGEQTVRAFGKISRKDAREPDIDSVYEIGSISKVFTGLLMGMDVLAGEYKETVPVEELLPESWSLARFKDQPIRLIDLATHTSALPRMPTNFRPADPRNPYADYPADKLRQFLAKFELRRAPGKRHLYSNLAIGLLGHTISARKGKAYEERLRTEICAPLGMTSTCVEANEDVAKRMTRAHLRNGIPTVPWGFGVMAPAGAIRSSTRDMLRFAQAYIDPPKGRLGDAIRASSVQKFALGKLRGVGHCIFLLSPLILGPQPGLPKNARILTHGGLTGGYAAQFFVLPERRLALVMLMNEAKTDENLGLDLFKRLLQRQNAKLKKR